MFSFLHNLIEGKISGYFKEMYFWFSSFSTFSSLFKKSADNPSSSSILKAILVLSSLIFWLAYLSIFEISFWSYLAKSFLSCGRLRPFLSIYCIILSTYLLDSSSKFAHLPYFTCSFLKSLIALYKSSLNHKFISKASNISSTLMLASLWSLFVDTYL